MNGDFKVGDSTFTIDKASGNTIVKGTATVEDRSKFVGNVTLGDHADILTAGSKRKVMLKQNAMHAWSFVDGGVAFESVAYDDDNGVVVTTVGTHPFGTNDAVVISDVQGSTELNEKLFVVEKESDVSFKLRGSTQISEYVAGGKAVKVSSSHVRPVNPTGISRTKPSYARLDAHGYDNSDVILFEDIPGGMSENLNGEEFIVLNNSGVNQFSYGYFNGTEVDARSFQPFEDSGTGRVGKLNRLVRNRTARILNITNDGKVTVEYPHDFEKGDIIVIGGVESGSGSGNLNGVVFQVDEELVSREFFIDFADRNISFSNYTRGGVVTKLTDDTYGVITVGSGVISFNANTAAIGVTLSIGDEIFMLAFRDHLEKDGPFVIENNNNNRFGVTGVTGDVVMRHLQQCLSHGNSPLSAFSNSVSSS